ncbi:hypothetical protein EDD69_11546 [Thermolongibacillus altinsuensis]|uniref:Uncharacterized protein n=1 Tax=Thermolongibacillus altinsuensis TaxID=575256 RepID=A0A4R1QDB0_9BACL|nr:diverged REC-like domain-containing protein [Thermolongibacillus altinsuensis]TCL46527.1 hypothetical protein EDD69_11546 [Thermolongibacillus altinsuensis]
MIRYLLKQTWKRPLQQMINEALKHYYSVSPSCRSMLTLLQGIDRALKYITVVDFDTPVDYYKTIAAVTDHLLQFVRNDQQPVIFSSLGSMTFFIERDCETCVVPSRVKMFVLDDQIHVYKRKAVHLCEREFEERPETICIYNVLTGKVTEIIDSMKVFTNDQPLLEINN